MKTNIQLPSYLDAHSFRYVTSNNRGIASGKDQIIKLVSMIKEGNLGGNGTSAARLLAEVDAIDRRHRAERPFLMDQVGDELRASSNSKFTFKFSLFHLYMLLVSFFFGGFWGVQLRSELNSRTATGGGNGLVYPIDLPKTGEGIKMRLAATHTDPTTAVRARGSKPFAEEAKRSGKRGYCTALNEALPVEQRLETLQKVCALAFAFSAAHIQRAALHSAQRYTVRSAAQRAAHQSAQRYTAPSATQRPALHCAQRFTAHSASLRTALNSVQHST